MLSRVKFCIRSALSSKDERASRGTTLILRLRSLGVSFGGLIAVTGLPGETYRRCSRVPASRLWGDLPCACVANLSAFGPASLKAGLQVLLPFTAFAVSLLDERLYHTRTAGASSFAREDKGQEHY